MNFTDTLAWASADLQALDNIAARRPLTDDERDERRAMRKLVRAVETLRDTEGT
ncbi:hypothetical protein [Rhodococcus sp. SJ-2]